MIGGNFNVLALDIYKQVIGQQNFNKGAVVGLILLVPVLLAFVVDWIMQGAHAGAVLGAGGRPTCRSASRGSTGRCFVFC